VKKSTSKKKTELTKLNIPPLRSRYVSRPQLTEKLEAGVKRHLTLVRALAGSGKTMLVSEWAHTCPYPLLWMSLHEADNDSARFWQYLIRLLDMIQPQTFAAALTLLQATGRASTEKALHVLADDLVALTSELVVVMDDYHVITNPVVHNDLAFLIDHLPSNMHIIIVSRTEPPLPLNRFRLRNQMVEITGADLRFSPDEIQHFLRDVMNLNMQKDDAAALEQRTEGWIAGIQLVGLSIQRFSQQQAQDFIKGFLGSQRYIFDYLAEEVLSKQSEETRQFLLKTAILDRFDAAICNALTGRKDSQKELEALEAANLFLITLNTGYRYHHLFADFLRARLQNDHPDWVEDLHRQASDWYEEYRQMREVVKHRLAIEDFDYAAEVVNRIAYEMLASAEYGLLLSWLESLPDHLFTTHPDLSIVHALVLSAVGAIDTAQEELDQVEQHLPDQSDSLKGLTLTVRSNIASVRGNIADVLRYANDALDNLPETDVLMRSVNMVTIAAYTGGSTALRLLHEALQMNQGDENRLMRITVMGNLSRFSQLRGDLAEAVRISQEALQVAAEWEAYAGRSLLSTYYIHAGLADALYRLGKLESAAEHAEKGVILSKLSGDVHKYVITGLTLAQIQWAQGDKEAAFATLEEKEAFCRKTTLPLQSTITSVRAQFALAESDIDTATQWLESQTLEMAFSRDNAYGYVTKVWALVVAERINEALELLEMMLAAQQDELMVDMLALKALAQSKAGDDRLALETMAEAVTYGFAAKDIWGIAQFGESIKPLMSTLLKAQRRGKFRDIGNPSYTLQVLRTLGGADNQPSTWNAPIKPLTKREIEVLRLMAQGLTNPAIAERLSISRHTVGNHARNIYDKLTASNRTQAVLKARELDLI
jgi:LuxR family transcriptional regulator, maltose regulon positive regulatory protein